MLNLAVYAVTLPDQPRCPPSLLCDSNESFPGVKQPECVDDHPPLLLPRCIPAGAIPAGALCGYAGITWTTLYIK